MFIGQQRTKEIGIRKTLGASVASVVSMLSKEFLKWVLVANVFAWPVAYWIMGKWLQGFAYRAEFGVWVFALSGLAAFVIAVITVSWQAIRAATINPVDALRYE
jgi:putative ABC transport system permease protein